MRIHKFADVILKVVEETTCEKPQQTFRKTKIDLTKILQHIMTSHVLFKPAASFECICCPAKINLLPHIFAPWSAFAEPHGCFFLSGLSLLTSWHI